MSTGLRTVLATSLLLACVACGGSNTSTNTSDAGTAVPEFSLTSPTIVDGGELPATYTCDGDSVSPPLAWSGEPSGTVGYAILMDHQPGPGDWHWYWTEWDIDAAVHSVGEGSIIEGAFGTNSVNDRLAYAPPCSKGPGPKSYTITIFALSEQPVLPDPTAVDRATLLDAVSDITLATDSIALTYTRS